jgi:hypothetical protein
MASPGQAGARVVDADGLGTPLCSRATAGVPVPPPRMLGVDVHDAATATARANARRRSMIHEETRNSVAEFPQVVNVPLHHARSRIVIRPLDERTV